MPLLRFTQQLDKAVKNEPREDALGQIITALDLVARVFYSLSYIDFPDVFETHMGEWMSIFSNYLT